MKRTPWFNADVLPVRAGVYEWRCLIATSGRISQATFDPSTLWDGTGLPTDWRPALNCKHCRWRGLTEKAEEQR